MSCLVQYSCQYTVLHDGARTAIDAIALIYRASAHIYMYVHICMCIYIYIYMYIYIYIFFHARACVCACDSLGLGTDLCEHWHPYWCLKENTSFARASAL